MFEKFPNGILKTQYGLLRWSLYGERVGISTSPLNAEDSEGPTLLRVNGVAYYMNVGLDLENGVWQAKNIQEWYIKRGDFTKNDYPSDSARKKITECVVKEWIAFIADKPELIHTARIARLEEKIKEKTEEVEKQEAGLKTLREELTSLVGRLSELTVPQ